MGDYLFDLFTGPVPKDVRGKYKPLIYLIRLSEALIVFGLSQPWYTSLTFGAERTGFSTGSGKLILVILIAGNIICWWRPFRIRMSQYAWVMAFVAFATFMLAYTETTGNPDDLFRREMGVYVTMAGAILRLVLGTFLGKQIEKEEQIMVMLGMASATIATRGTDEKEPAP